MESKPLLQSMELDWRLFTVLGMWESLTLWHPALPLQPHKPHSCCFPWPVICCGKLLVTVRGMGGICQCRQVKLSRFYIRTNSELCNLPQTPVTEQVLWQVSLCPAHTPQPENVGCIFCSGGIFHLWKASFTAGLTTEERSCWEWIKKSAATVMFSYSEVYLIPKKAL